MKHHTFTGAFTTPALLAACLLLAACRPAAQSDPKPQASPTAFHSTPAPAPETTPTQPGDGAMTPAPKPKPRMSAKIPPEKMIKYNGQPGLTRISWSTESEKNSFGFNIMRSKSPNGPFEPANEDPILGAAGNSSTHIEYEFFDTHVKVGEGYYYYNQQIDLEGRKTDHKDKMLYANVTHLNLDQVKGDPVLEDTATTSTDSEDAPAAPPAPVVTKGNAK